MDVIEDIMKRSRKDKNDSVTWFQWVKDDVMNRFQKVVQHGTLRTLVEYFLKILPEFLKHSYIKRCQAASFERDNDDVSESNGKVATLQIDYAENFGCEAQDEIQSAHWNQANV